MNDRVVDDVRTVRRLVEDRSGLIDEVDLEPNDVVDLSSVVPRDRDTRHEIDEGLATFLVVDERDLALLKLVEVRLEVVSCARIGVTSLLPSNDLLISGSLKEAT